MRRIIKLASCLFFSCLLLTKAFSAEAGYNPGLDPEIDEEYYDVEFMGEYIEGGVLIEGNSLKTSYPYMDYEFSNVTRNSEKIKANKINTSFAGDNQYIYEFDVTVGDDFLLMNPVNDENLPSQIITANGETLYGSILLKAIDQKLHVIYNPQITVSEGTMLQYDCEYEYTFTPTEGGEERKGIIRYEQEFMPYLMDQSNSSTLDFTEVFQELDSSTLILMYDSRSSYYGSDENGNELNFEMTQYSIPFVVEGGSIIYAYASTGDYELVEEVTPVEEKTNPLIPIVSVMVLVGISQVVAVMGSAVEGVVSSGAGFVEMVAKRMEEEKAFYEIEFNGGVDFPPVVCEAEKKVEIPVRIDGGEDDFWLLKAKCVMEHQHTKKIAVSVAPVIKGSSVIKITLQGGEFTKDDKIQVSLVAVNPKKLSQTMLGVFEFDLVKKKI